MLGLEQNPPDIYFQSKWISASKKRRSCAFGNSDLSFVMQLFAQDPLVKLTHPLKARQETYLLIIGLYYCPHCYPLPLEVSPKDLQSPQMTSNETVCKQHESYYPLADKVLPIIKWWMLAPVVLVKPEEYLKWSCHTGGVLSNTDPWCGLSCLPMAL